MKGDIDLRLPRIRYNAPVTLTFALLSLGVLVLNQLTNGWTTTMLFSVYRAPLTDPLTYVRFLGHVLGHSSYDHYISNMIMILLIGPPIEEKYGSTALIWAIIATAIITGIVQFAFFPTAGLLGASGLVYMMVILLSFSGTREGGVPLTFLLIIALYLSSEVVDLFTKVDDISQITHIVGGVCGAGIGAILNTRRTVR